MAQGFLWGSKKASLASNFALLTPDQALLALHISQGLVVTDISDSSAASGTN